MDIQKKIKGMMAGRGWTDYRLCKESGLSASTVANMFNESFRDGGAEVSAFHTGFHHVSDAAVKIGLSTALHTEKFIRCNIPWGEQEYGVLLILHGNVQNKEAVKVHVALEVMRDFSWKFHRISSLTQSSRSITLSCGVAPWYSVEQFSLTIW